MPTALELSRKYKSLLNRYEVNTPKRLSELLGQLSHESGLKPISENLNYSAERLLQIFPKYFKTLEEAKRYERKPQAIANKVYASRMGNGNEASGDGWRFRGRGFTQNTGRNNYQKLKNSTGIDFVNNPDLLLEEVNSMVAALEYWKSINGNAMADRGDTKAITKAINGGYTGLADRIKEVNEMKKIFGT